MFPPLGGQFPDAVMVFRDQRRPDKELLDDLADGAGRQCQTRGKDVQLIRAFRQDVQVLLLVRAEPEFIDLFQLARPFKMAQHEFRFAHGTANPMAGL